MDAKELWLGKRPGSDLLVLEEAPRADREPDAALEAEFEVLQRLVTRVRTARANARLADAVRLDASVKPLDEARHRLLLGATPVLSRLANLDSLRVVSERPEGAVSFVDPVFELFIDLSKHVDLAAELRGIDKEMAELRKKLDQVRQKLDNPKFLSGAKPEVVESQKSKDRELREMLDKLDELRRTVG
jgi:valyl-tRNA synthetase